MYRFGGVEIRRFPGFGVSSGYLLPKNYLPRRNFDTTKLRLGSVRIDMAKQSRRLIKKRKEEEKKIKRIG